MSKTKDQTKNEYRKTDVNVELLLIIKSPPFLKTDPQFLHILPFVHPEIKLKVKAVRLFIYFFLSKD